MATTGLPILPSEEYIVKSKASPFDLKSGNAAKYLFDSFPTWKDAIALVCSETDEKVSYSDLKDLAYKWGGFLTQLGFTKGDVIGFASPNCLDFVPMMLGTAAIGAILSTVSDTAKSGEIARIFSKSKPKLVIYFEALEDTLKEALKMAVLDPILVPTESSTNKQNLREVLRGEVTPILGPVELIGEECFAIVFSSGTTGMPKCVAISHNSYIRNCQQYSSPSHTIGNRATEKQQDVQLLISPFAHIGGITSAFLAITKAFKLIVLPKVNEETMMTAMKNNKVTYLPALTAILNILTNRSDFNRHTLPGIKAIITGGSAVPDALITKVRRKLSQEIMFFQHYGMSETLGSHRTLFSEADKNGRIQLLYGVDALVLDVVTRKPLPRNEAGEICVRTPSTMMYYLNDPEATRQTLTEDGWILSGDFGFYDDEGYLHVTDRLKNLIKVGVHQVFPGEIEEVLLQHPAIAECCVIGVKNEQLGEAPKGFIVKKGPLEEDEVHSFLGKRLAKQKQLTGGVIFLERIPKSNIGKIVRKDLE